MRDLVSVTSTNEQDVSPKQNQQYKQKHTSGARTPTKFQQNEHTQELCLIAKGSDHEDFQYLQIQNDLWLRTVSILGFRK